MAHQTLIQEPDHIQWALDKFCTGLHPVYFPGACMLTGSEDAPEKLEFYKKAQPLVTDTPFLVVNFSGE